MVFMNRSFYLSKWASLKHTFVVIALTENHKFFKNRILNLSANKNEQNTLDDLNYKIVKYV